VHRLRASALSDLLAVPTSRRLFVAHTQSAFGNGAGYVALLLLTYAHTHSALVVSAVLVADWLPSMLLGPWLGALADRSSRRRCCVAADLLRAVAFAGLALVSAPVALVAFALMAGVGTALFSPAVLAGLGGVYDEERLPRAVSLYGAVDEAGMLVGPVLAAALLTFTSAASVMALNAASFVISALLIGGVALRPGNGTAESVTAATWSGLRQILGMPAVARLMAVSTLAVLSLGMVNVAEVVFALKQLDAGPFGLSVLMAAMGSGVTVGALGGMRAGDQTAWLRRYLAGLALMGFTLVAAGLIPVLPLAVVAFFGCGLGNGLAITHERLLLVRAVPEHLHGRVFAIKRSAVAWAFSVSFVSAGALCAAIGASQTLTLAGGGALAAFCLGSLSLPGRFAAGAIVPQAA
jgi:Major Facilitator Superfamily